MDTISLFITGSSLLWWLIPMMNIDMDQYRTRSLTIAIQSTGNHTSTPIAKKREKVSPWEGEQSDKNISRKKNSPILLSFDIIPKYSSPSPILPAYDPVSIHAKNYKESIYRYGVDFEPVTYAWEKWKDIDFILMIQEESLWDDIALGDEWASIWYCQINKYYGEKEFNEYIKMETWKERINFCHSHYLRFRHIVWNVFHGWNSRERNLKSFSFK